jgi:hypothetical protein
MLFVFSLTIHTLRYIVHTRLNSNFTAAEFKFKPVNVVHDRRNSFLTITKVNFHNLLFGFRKCDVAKRLTRSSTNAINFNMFYSVESVKSQKGFNSFLSFLKADVLRKWSTKRINT